ncbi:MAG: adenylyltransferase/cytidyltransferase family protein [Propionibacteriaceae bacterium]
MTTGYLANSFDLINVRDLDLIGQAAELCSHVIVGVFSDDFAEEVYGRRPVVPLMERLSLVQHVRGVDEVVVHESEASVPAVPHVYLAVSGDLSFGQPASAHLLIPRRESASVVLREALEPIRQDEVA